MTAHRGADQPGTLEDLLELLATGGSITYGGEPVSVAEHALQAARLAEDDGAAPSLVTAALFHDIGWLLVGPGGHEGRGSRALAAVFGPAVTEPVRLHVAAKRYRCTIEPGYAAELSVASTRTLRAQGGLMDDEEVAAFVAEPRAVDALVLRGYDDRAKDPGATTPDLAHFAATARSCAEHRAPGAHSTGPEGPPPPA